MLGHQRTRVRPSRSSSVIAMIIGFFFIILGITTILPMAGLFGVIWTLGAIGITAYHAINVFSSKGVSMYTVTTTSDSPSTPASDVDRLDSELRKLHKLKEDGLISEEEFLEKREQLMK